MVKIKVAKTKEDVEQVQELFLEYTNWVKENFVSIGLLTIIDPRLHLFNTEKLPGKYSAPSGLLLLAIEGDLPVGCMFLRKDNNTNCELKGFYIRPQARGNGLAIKMMNRLCEEAQKLGYHHMRISSHNFTSKAIQMYREYGFYEIPNYLDEDLLQAGDIQMEYELVNIEAI
jgi:GNAT superfamily N-acetyltransferase